MSEPGGPYGNQPPYNQPPYSPPPYSPPPGYAPAAPPGYAPAPTPAYGYPPPASPPTAPPYAQPNNYEYGYAGPQPQWAAPPVAPPAPVKKTNVWLLGITLVVLVIDVIAAFSKGAAKEPRDAAYIVGYTLTGPIIAAIVGGIACLFARPRRISNLGLSLALVLLLVFILGSLAPETTT